MSLLFQKNSKSKPLRIQRKKRNLRRRDPVPRIKIIVSLQSLLIEDIDLDLDLQGDMMIDAEDDLDHRKFARLFYWDQRSAGMLSIFGA
jgi:hypothetical protein